MEVMVLEDDASLRFALSEVVKDAGHNVFAVGTIAGAIETLRRARLDVLFLDLLIGSESSIQIADLAALYSPDVEIVYLTGSDKFPNGEIFEMCANTTWVLRKPLEFTELKSMLSHLELSVPAASETKSIELGFYR